MASLKELDRSPMLAIVANVTAFVMAGSAVTVAYHSGHFHFVVPPLLLAGFAGHAFPLMFHDAAHGTLHPIRWKNEALGILFGCAIFVPLSVYRHAHTLHHRCLGTPQDPELWPFTLPDTSRAFRLTFALVETMLGCIVTPLLFLRAVLIADRLSDSQKRRITAEYAAIVLYWGSIVSIVSMFELWSYFLLSIVAPVAVGGAFQTINKYVEHMGMTGSGVLGTTRSVADHRTVGRMLSATMQHVAHHSAHHLFAKIPYYRLPEATSYLYGEEATKESLYSSYWAAFVAMSKTLRDPRVGPQWKNIESSCEV